MSIFNGKILFFTAINLVAKVFAHFSMAPVGSVRAQIKHGAEYADL